MTEEYAKKVIVLIKDYKKYYGLQKYNGVHDNSNRCLKTEKFYKIIVMSKSVLASDWVKFL